MKSSVNRAKHSVATVNAFEDLYLRSTDDMEIKTAYMCGMHKAQWHAIEVFYMNL